MAATDVKPEVEKLSVERKSFEITYNKDLFHHDELSPEDREFLETFGEERRKAVIRKVDWRLIPVLALLYLISYIDRANIGNAKIEGLVDDLHLTGTQYNIALSIFFVPYILFEIPSNNLLLKFKRPSLYMTILVVSWGTVMTLHGIVKGFSSLIVVRIFLGVTEAGFFPGAVYLISTWYLPNETQVRIALFYSSSALAGAFSGLLAFAITKMDGLGGIAGWRWIFIVEGVVSILGGLLCYFLMVDTPALSTRWLESDEIRYLELRKQAQAGNTPRIRRAEEKRKWRIFFSVLTDWQIYIQALVVWSTGVPNIGLKFTMPQIIKNMGFTSSKAQLLTMPPYLIGALSAYLSALAADKYTWRMPFIVSAQSAVVVAFAVLFAKAADIKNNIGTCYFAVTLACIGLYPITPGVNAWMVSNLAGPTKRAQGVAYLISLGNIGGMMGSFIYIEKEKPKYPTGFGASLGFAAMGIIACIILESIYAAKNKRRHLMTEQDIREKYSQERLDELGDRSPLFRYAL